MRVLEGRERESRDVERQAKARAERRNRDDFREVLREQVRKQVITVRMRWKEFLPHVAHEDAYR